MPIDPVNANYRIFIVDDVVALELWRCWREMGGVADLLFLFKVQNIGCGGWPTAQMIHSDDM